MGFLIATVLVALGASSGVGRDSAARVGAALAVLHTGDAEDPRLIACAAPGGEVPSVRLYSPESRSFVAAIVAPGAAGSFATTLTTLRRETGGDALLIAATPHGDGPGELYLVSPPEWNPELVCRSPVGAQQRFGASIAVLGEGADQRVLVGAPALQGAKEPNGAIFVVSLAEKRIIAEWRAPTPSERFGAGVVPIADVNDDGYAEVLVASASERNIARGALLLLSSVDGAVLRRFENEERFEVFTGAVASVTNHATGERRVFAVTHVSRDVRRPAALNVRAWNLGTGRRIPGALPMGEPGYSPGLSLRVEAAATLLAIGDVNGDGVDDLLAGFPDFDAGPRGHTGVAIVVSGADGSRFASIPCDGSQRQIGFALAYDDSPSPLAVIGAPDEGLFAGVVHLFALRRLDGPTERVTF